MVVVKCKVNKNKTELDSQHRMTLEHSAAQIESLGVDNTVFCQVNNFKNYYNIFFLITHDVKKIKKQIQNKQTRTKRNKTKTLYWCKKLQMYGRSSYIFFLPKVSV